MIAALVLSPLSARGEPKPAAAAWSEAAAAVAAATSRLAAAVERQDAATIASLYTSDGVLILPDGELFHNVPEVWGTQFRAGTKISVSFASQRVEVEGGLATDVGDFKISFRPDGKPAQFVEGRYVVVCRRQNDGSWLFARQLWTSRPPAGGGERNDPVTYPISSISSLATTIEVPNPVEPSPPLAPSAIAEPERARGADSLSTVEAILKRRSEWRERLVE
jgi:ketosteroid isomerase-like protein